MPKTDPNDLKAQRAQVQAQLDALNNQEAAHDVALLEEANKLLAAPAVKTLAERLTAIRDGLLNPVRAEQVGNAVIVLTQVPQTVANHLNEARGFLARAEGGDTPGGGDNADDL